MGTRYLIDSNAVIDYLRGSLPDPGMTFMNNVVNELPNVSIITKIEVLGFNAAPEASELLVDFFEDALVLPLSEDVVKETIRLRKKYKIKLPDAIIAATAIASNLKLITRNTADFGRIEELNCIDTHKAQ
jgi:predicted nucleic acid-binding protein